MKTSLAFGVKGREKVSTYNAGPDMKIESGGSRRTISKLPTTSSRRTKVLLYLTSFSVGVAIWWISATLVHSNLFPTPAAVVNEMVNLYQKGQLTKDILASLGRVALGFALGIIFAVPVGFATGWYSWIRGALEPWINFFRSVPPLALIPMAIILLGIGSFPKYLVIALAAFLPTVVAIQQGVTDVDATLVNAARVLGAKQGTIFRRVVIPAVMPMAFTGMRIALGNSWATLVAAELIASQSGLGYLTLQGQLYFDIPEIIIGVLLIGILGVIMDRMIYFTQLRLTSWQERH